MSPAEADQRIILSRRTLLDYMSLAAVGVAPTSLDRTLIADEIVFLGEMAASHPSKADKLATLIDKWVTFQNRLRNKLH